MRTTKREIRAVEIDHHGNHVGKPLPWIRANDADLSPWEQREILAALEASKPAILPSNGRLYEIQVR